MRARGSNQYAVRGPAVLPAPLLIKPLSTLGELVSGQMERADSSASAIAASVSAQLDALGVAPSRALPLQVISEVAQNYYYSDRGTVTLAVPEATRPPARWRQWVARRVPFLPQPSPRPDWRAAPPKTLHLDYGGLSLRPPLESAAVHAYATCVLQCETLEPGPLCDKATEVLNTLSRALWGVAEIGQGSRQLHQTAADLQFVEADPALTIRLQQVERQATDYVKTANQRFQQISTMFQQLSKAQQLLGSQRADVVAAAQVRLGELERAVDSLLQDAETTLSSLVG